jgi:hypothetical protein
MSRTSPQNLTQVAPHRAELETEFLRGLMRRDAAIVAARARQEDDLVATEAVTRPFFKVKHIRSAP